MIPPSPKIVTLEALTDMCHTLTQWTSRYRVAKVTHHRVYVQCERATVRWTLVLPAYRVNAGTRIVIDPLEVRINQLNVETDVFDELLNWPAMETKI